MTLQRTWIATAVSLALSSTAFAQSPPVVTPSANSSTQSATSTAEVIKRGPSIETVTVVGSKTRQFDDYDDLVRQLPGVTVSKGDDRWGATGFNIRGLDEDRVAIAVDGVPQGESLKYETGQAYGYFKGVRNGVDTEALKAVQIVKGADAILSGSGALSGSVSMTTKDPADYLNPGDDAATALKTRYTSANDETMGALTLAGRSGKLEGLVHYTHRDGHEYRSFDEDGLDIIGSAREIPDPMDITLDSVLLKTNWVFRPGHQLGITASIYDQNRYTDAQSFNGGWYANRIGDDFSKTRRLTLTHEYNQQTLLFDTITTALTKQTSDFEANTSQYVYIVTNNRVSADEDRVDTRSFDQELAQFTLDLEKAIAVGSLMHNLVYGVELQDKEFVNAQLRDSNSRLNSLGWVTRNIGSLLPKAEAEIRTLYALDTVSLNPQTLLRVGARYDDYTYDAESDANFTDRTKTLRDVNFSTASWTVGLERALSDNYTLELGISTGFRAPTIEDMYSTSGNADDWSTIANPDLEAEYSTNFDVALSGNLGEDGLWRAGIFVSRFEDFIDYVPTSGINTNTGLPDPNGYSTPMNFNEVDMQGFEFSTTLGLETLTGIQGLNTTLQGAYTEGENSNGDPVYSVQPYNIAWSLGYAPRPSDYGINLFATHNSGKNARDAYRTSTAGVRTYPLYLSNTATVLDLMGYLNIGDLTFSAAINNLTDKEYYNWDSVRFLDQGDARPGIGVTGNGVRRYSETGRNYELTVNYQF